MTYIQNLWVYFALLFGIIIVPGMDMLFVLTNAIKGGWKLGFAAVAGVMLGGVFHTFFGAFCVIMVSVMPPIFFQTLIIAGSLYMAWIGYSLIKSSIFVDKIDEDVQKSYWVAFRQGAISCITNPKAYAFVIAVYPAFIKPQYGAIWSQALMMGILTVVTQFAIYGGLALAAIQSKNLLLGHRDATIWFSRLVGAFFMLVAAYSLIYALKANF